MQNALDNQLMLQSNPSIYDAKELSYSYENGATYAPPVGRYLAQFVKDIQFFVESQIAIYSRTEISQGDWVLLKDGTYSRVTVNCWDDSIQVGGCYGNAVYINGNGFASYSGTCGDVIERKDIEPSDFYKAGKCWIFSNRNSGAHRGVTNILNFKVWIQK
jgi:hypothetical protein